MSSPFSSITKGPSNTTGKNTSPQSLTFDSQNNIMATVGDVGSESALQTAMQVINAQTALTTITTAQTLISLALKAGVLNRLARTLTVSGSIIYTTPGTTTPAITLAIKLGSVTLCSIVLGACSSTASTNMPIQFSFELDVASVGASGTIEAHGQVNANLTANTPAAASSAFLDTNTAVSSAVDLTAAQTLTVTIAANSAVSSAQLRQATIELVA